MAYTVIFSYDSRTPGRRAGPFRQLKKATQAVKCKRKTVFKAGAKRWEVNCGDTVIADVYLHKKDRPV